MSMLMIRSFWSVPQVKDKEKIMPEVAAWQNRPLESVCPHTQVQRYIVHQIRSSTRFVSYKDIKPIQGLKCGILPCTILDRPHRNFPPDATRQPQLLT